jgi:hypothetical protein
VRLWLTKDAVSLGDVRLDVADLILLGLLRGTWQRFEADVRLGLHLERAHPRAVTDDAVRAAATAFRYAHGLISAADFKAWLQARELTVAQVSGVLRRSLLREHFAEPEDAGDEALGSVLIAEAHCHDQLSALADAAVDGLVAEQRIDEGLHPSGEAVDAALAEAVERTELGLPSLGEQVLRERLEPLSLRELKLQRLRETVADEAGLKGRITDHGLDWVRLTGDELVLRTEGAAREARMLMVEDRVDVEALVARAGAEVSVHALYLEDAPDGMTAPFAAAAPGEVLGPWRDGEEWRLLLLADKRRPTVEDPVLRQRATEEMLADVIKRHAAGRVQRNPAL